MDQFDGPDRGRHTEGSRPDRLLALVERVRDDRLLGTGLAVAALLLVAAGYAAFRVVQPPAPPRAEDVLPRVALTPTSAPTTTAAPVLVHVVGAVLEPGVRQLPAGARVLDAVTAAGGPDADADLSQLNLAAPVTDGSQVRVPLLGEAAAGPLVVGPAPAAGTAGSSRGAPAGPVPLNRAGPAELEELPGVGPTTAAAIVAWRDANGRFTSVDQLLEVRGIGPAKFEAIRELVVVG